jgi:hypothetical protein
MTRPRAPLTLARAGCEFAVRRLPELDDRLRYRAEFLAEIHDLPPAAQLRFAAGVMSQMFALRAALGASPTRAEEAAMSTTTATRVPFFRCRVFRWHRWVVRSTEDGGRYSTCGRCGRDWYGSPSAGTGGFAAGGSFGM